MSTLAYHFVNDTLRDGRPIPPDGEWLEHVGHVEICASGLHASRRPWHALGYAPGPVLCLVEVDKIEAERCDKLVARRRRIVRRVDLTDDLHAFARQCALDVVHLWNAPDAVRRYLETGDDALRTAARTAAKAAAKEWITAQAWTTAKKAAWNTAWITMWHETTYDAATAAAWAAARAVAWSESAKSDATSDAWITARDAALDAQGRRFDALCAACLEVRL